MHTPAAIRTRRSIRRFQPRPVANDLRETLLRAAMAAPTAGNAQTWDFLLIDDPAQLAAASTVHGGATFLKDAPLGILVCGDPRREKMPGFWVQDCSAAAEHILLAAHALELGGCWIGLHPLADMVAKIRTQFGIPEAVVPLALIAVGHPAEALPPEDRYDTTKLHLNHW